MSSYGRILAAGIEVDGSQLRVDHSATDTTLDLDDCFDFYEPSEGEVIQVRVVAEDGTEELATIKVPETEDEETVIADGDNEGDLEGFIILASGLENDYPAGTRVEVFPKTQRLVAQVRLDDAEEDTETIDAVVHHSLYAMIPEGNDLDIAVEMDYDGETFYVVNVLGEPPQVDGGFISPGTVDYPALADQVGSIRIVDAEADLATLEAKPGDAAYVRGEAGLYKYMDTQPSVTTYDAEGDPVLTPIDPVTGTTNWYRTTDAADILANSITASHLQVETLSAITADLGTVTAGTFTGGTFRTAESGERIEISGDTDPDRIWFHSSAGTNAGSIRIESNGRLNIRSTDDGIELGAPDSEVHISFGHLKIGTLSNEATNALLLRNVTNSDSIPNPPAGFIAIFWNSAIGHVQAKNSAGDTRAVTNTSF